MCLLAYGITEKYVAHVEPQCRAVDKDFDKLSLGRDNGFLWDVVNLESSELQPEDGVPREHASSVTSAPPPNFNPPEPKRFASRPDKTSEVFGALLPLIFRFATGVFVSG